MKHYLVSQFREGIFLLNTRRFGKIAEIMIKQIYHFDWSHSKYYDLYDSNNQQKIEVKFSTVREKATTPINENNAIEQVLYASKSNRPVCYSERFTTQYVCNIQQVKKALFDVLYYGLFYKDKICIFKIPASNINPTTCPSWSEKQHKGNKNEGQFHITNETLTSHLNDAIERELSYDELFDLLNPYHKLFPIVCDILKSKIKRIKIWKNLSRN